MEPPPPPAPVTLLEQSLKPRGMRHLYIPAPNALSRQRLTRMSGFPVSQQRPLKLQHQHWAVLELLAVRAGLRRRAAQCAWMPTQIGKTLPLADPSWLAWPPPQQKLGRRGRPLQDNRRPTARLSLPLH